MRHPEKARMHDTDEKKTSDVKNELFNQEELPIWQRYAVRVQEPAPQEGYVIRLSGNADEIQR